MPHIPQDKRIEVANRLAHMTNLHNIAVKQLEEQEEDLGERLKQIENKLQSKASPMLVHWKNKFQEDIEKVKEKKSSLQELDLFALTMAAIFQEPNNPAVSFQMLDHKIQQIKKQIRQFSDLLYYKNHRFFGRNKQSTYEKEGEYFDAIARSAVLTTRLDLVVYCSKKQITIPKESIEQLLVEEGIKNIDKDLANYKLGKKMTQFLVEGLSSPSEKRFMSTLKQLSNDELIDKASLPQPRPARELFSDLKGTYEAKEAKKDMASYMQTVPFFQGLLN